MRPGRFVWPGKKALLPVLGGLAGLGIVVAVVAIVLQIRERDRRMATERELVMALAENEDLTAQRDALQQAKAELEEELSLAQGELLKVTGELEEAKAAQQALTKALEDRQNEIDRLTKDLEQSRTTREQLAQDLGELRSQRVGLQQRVDDLETAKAELERKVLELADQSTVELEKVVVGDDEGSMTETFRSDYLTPVSLTTGGQIVVVNREYDFVVMNLGKNHGLLMGQEFQVLRGTEVIGGVKVEKVYDELSAASVLPGTDPDLLQEGDGVRAL